jgi:hypothetical protein
MSRLFDHTEHQYYTGHEQLHLGWSDGNGYIPVDFCIKSGKDLINGMDPEKDGRTQGGIRRRECSLIKPEQCLQMLKRCIEQGLDVSAVVFDTWFSKPKFLIAVTQIGYDVVCHLPTGDRIWRVNYNGHSYTLKNMYRKLTNERDFVRIQIGNIDQKIASVVVTHQNGLRLKLVFCKLKNKVWNVYAATDIELDDRTILETYAKRWKIESFFKFSRQHLRLGKEQSPDLDVQIAMTTIRMIIFAVLNWIHRQNNDDRTLGILFSDLENEFSNPNMDPIILERIFQMALTVFGVIGFCGSQLELVSNTFRFISDNFRTLRLCSAELR